MKRRLFIPLFALALAFGLIACNAEIEETVKPPQKDSGAVLEEVLPQKTPNDAPSSPEPQKIDKAKAKEIALNHAKVKEGDIVGYEIEFDIDDGISSYEIEFRLGKDEYDYDISSETGEILKAEKNDKSILVTDNSKLKTEAEVKEISINHAGLKAENITAYKIELDEEKGVKVYEIEFKSAGYEYDYEINAQNGEIIKSQKEIDD